LASRGDEFTGDNRLSKGGLIDAKSDDKLID